MTSRFQRVAGVSRVIAKVFQPRFERTFLSGPAGKDLPNKLERSKPLRDSKPREADHYFHLRGRKDRGQARGMGAGMNSEPLRDEWPVLSAKPAGSAMRAEEEREHTDLAKK